jgi:hypothetical protein
MRLLSTSLMIGAACLCLALAGPVRDCLMSPSHLQMRLPDRGINWLEGEELSGACDAVPEKDWMRGRSGSENLFVHADGPSGSGRFWTVTVGVGGRSESKPIRGVCFSTSTVGWRTLQRYGKGPLPWLEDLDHDGRAELIVWSSFPLREDASMAEYGLAAWVYRFSPDGTLSLDWELSQQMAHEIAEAYRVPLDPKDQLLEPLRAEAAEALERFANELCSRPSVESTLLPAHGRRDSARGSRPAYLRQHAER